MSSSPDNNNAQPFSYGNNSFIKTEMPFIKNDLHYIKTEMPYIGHRNIFTDQTGIHLLKPPSKKITLRIIQNLIARLICCNVFIILCF